MIDQQIHKVEIRRISPSPTNPRKFFNEGKLRELSESVRTHGVLQPILIRHKKDSEDFELIAGERRFRASIMADLTEIPAFIREMSDLQVLEVQVIENLQRDDLHPLEEAEGYEKLMKEHGYTAELLAQKVNKSKAYIYAKLKLAALCKKAREAFYDGKLNESTALLIARIPLASLQAQALKSITELDWRGEPMSFRSAAKHIQDNFMLRIDQAPFKTTDVDLLKGAGSCRECPKLAANQPEIFTDLKFADVCTDPECFARKKAANIAKRVAEAEAKGLSLIHGEAAKKLFPHGPQHSQSWTPLNDRNFYHEGGKTYRELLKGDMPPVTLIEDVKRGILVECVETSAANKILGVKKINSPYQQGGSNEDQKKKEKENREENNFRASWLDEIRFSFQKDLPKRSLPLFPTLNPAELRMVAKTMFSGIDFETRRRLVALWIDEKITHDLVYEFERNHIDKLSDADICALLIDCCLIGETHVATWSAPKTERMADFSTRFGIDHDQMRREHKAQIKAKEKASKPPAKQKKEALAA